MKTVKRALLAGAMMLAGMTTAGGAAYAENGQKPQYGGSLEIGTVYVTLSALSFDPNDWNWKLNHDTGQFYEQLIASYAISAGQRISRL